MSSTDTNMRNNFADLLRTLKIAEFENVIIKAEKYDLIKAFFPSQPLYRFRAVNEHSILALRNEWLAVTKPNKMKDIFDSQIYVDDSKVKKEFSFFTSVDTDGMSKWLFDGKPIPHMALNAVSPVVQQAAKKMQGYLKKNPNSRPMLKMAQENLKGEIDNLIKSESHFDNDVLRKTGYIACFCESVNAIRMWDEFAQGHTGFAVEYDFTIPNAKRIFGDISYMVLPVIYGESYDATELYIHTLLNNWLKRILNHRPLKLLDELAWIKGYLYKSSEYSIENEWRLITPIKGVSADAPEFSSLPIKPVSIYFGSKMTTDNYKIISEIADNKGLKKYKMEINLGLRTVTPTLID